MRLTEFPSALANRPLRSQRPWWRARRLVFVAIGGVAALVVVAFAIIVGIVLSGPTEVGFVRDRIEAALAGQLGPSYTVSVGRAVVDVDPVLGLVIEVDDVAVADSESTVVARAPQTRLAVDPLSLLRFKVSVTSVEATGTQISLVRSDDGQVYLGNAQTVHAAARQRETPPPNVMPGAADGGFPDLFLAFQILDRGLGPPIDAAVAAGFLRFNLVGGEIAVWDATLLRERRFPDTDINVAVDAATGSLTASTATSGYSGRWTANLERTIDAATGNRYLSGVFSQLSLADLFPGLADEDTLFDADIPLYGRASLAFGADGALQDASVRLDVGAGVFRFGERRETVILDEATVRLKWDIANKVVIVEPSPFFFGETRGVVTGSIRPEGDGESRRYAFSFESDGAILSPRDSNEKPLVADRIGLSGVADMRSRLVTINNFTLATAKGSVSAAGSLGFEGPTPSLAMAASFSPMPASTLKQIWVPFLAPGARRWVMEHILGGDIAEARFEAAIPGGILWNPEQPPMPPEAIKLEAKLTDVSFTTIGDLPAVVKASGNLVLNGATFGIDLEKGEVVTKSGTVAVQAGAFAVDNVFKRGADGLIEIQLSGGAAALGAIANARPIQALEKLKVTPADLSGQADASVSIRLPLAPDITEGDLDWKVTVTGKGLGSKAPIEGRVFTKADVTIVVTPAEVQVNGKANIDGVAADVALTQPIGVDGVSAGPGQQVARLTLDAAARKRLGIGLDGILGGTVGALVSSLGDGQPGQRYDLDLKQARLTVPGVGWSKGIGVPAKVFFDLKPVKDGFFLDNLILQGEGFGLSGTAMLDANHSLVSADIAYFSLRPGDDISLKLKATKSGYAITARGASFDMRGVIAELKGDGGSGTDGADISVDGEVASLSGYNGQTLSNAKFSYVLAGGVTRKATLTGGIGGAPLSIAYDGRANGATLDASAGDAGSVFRFADIYTRVGGGSLAVSATRQGRAGALSGRFEVDNFEILDEPAVKSMIENARPPEGVNPARLRFDRMVARFRATDQAITIDDALIKGAAIGATFDGRIDLIRSTIGINGTYIPAYAFNNAFSRVPIIGTVLGGGNREGLIGVTFRVEGPIGNPRVLFNPLSAVTPGIFRKIFEFR